MKKEFISSDASQKKNEKDTSPPGRFARWFPRIQEWDVHWAQRIYTRFSSVSNHRIARVISLFGDPRLWGFAFLIPFILGYIRRDFSLFVIFSTAFSQSFLIYYSIKLIVARYRPFVQIVDINRRDNTGHGYSFPSGHAHHSTILVGLLWLLYFPSPWFIPLLLTYNALIALSRIISGCHFPSDALWGIGEGYIELFVFWFLCRPFYLSLYESLFPLVFPNFL